MVPFLRYLKPNFSRHWGSWLLAPLLAFMVGFVPSSAFAALWQYSKYSGSSPEEVLSDYVKDLEPYTAGARMYKSRSGEGCELNDAGTAATCEYSHYIYYTHYQYYDTLYGDFTVSLVENDCPESGSLQMFQGYAASKSACSDLNGSNTEFGHDSCGYKITTSSVTDNPVTCSSPGSCFNEGKYLCTFTAVATGDQTELGPYDFPEPEPEDPDGEGEDTGNSDGDTGSEDDETDGTGTDPDETDGT
ncbi:hypothetical protein, partial [Marinobacterium stanieri]